MPSKKELTEELIRISREIKEEAKKLTEKQNVLMKEIQKRLDELKKFKSKRS
jgi:hypothetical protein